MTHIPRTRKAIHAVSAMALGCCCQADATAQCSVSFGLPVRYAVGGSPLFVATGDLNGDGRLDLVTAGQVGVLSVLLGNGDGTFQVSGFSTPAPDLNCVAVGNLNGDAHADLAAVNVSTNTFPGAGVFLGNGNGTFQTPSTYRFGNAPYYIVIADFDADGDSDLAVANLFGHSVSILLGNGTGGFSAPVTTPTGFQPTSIAVGDFNADTRLDLAFGSRLDTSISVRLGNGNGTFAPRTGFPAGSPAYSIAAADLNSDGVLDLATANENATCSILLGNGNGTFQPPSMLAIGGFGYSVAVRDLNSDTFLDLAATNLTTDNISILVGNGDGTFESGVIFAAGDGPSCVAVGDFNGDLRPDMAVTNYFSSILSVYLNVVPTQVPLSIVQQPVSATVCPTGFQTFSVGVTGPSPSYQWQRETPAGSGRYLDLVNGTTSGWDGSPPGVGGVVAGATTPVLTISAAIASSRWLSTPHAIRYRAVVTNECGSFYTSPVTLSVCRADFNCDDEVDSRDFFQYVAAFFANSPLADFDRSGFVNSTDFFNFLAAFFTGC